MSQILILILYVMWVSAAGERLPRGPVDWGRVVLFLLGFVLIALVPAVVARWKTRAAISSGFWTLQHRFGRLMTVCRFAIPIWFGLGLFGGDAWLNFVGAMLAPIRHLPLVFPGMLLGPLPALLAWTGLWWAQYPIDQLARDQSVLPLLESNLPVHAPPTLWSFLTSTLRLQVLATVVPLLLIGLLRDVGSVGMLLTGAANPRAPGPALVLSVCSAMVVLMIAPEALRRILRTQRLPASSLRDKLDALCALARTRYREVLLWRTHYGMGNAAVMGVLPQIRYVLLSDLLLETMNDREIEAVFAHELGHIVYRHTIWFVIFIIVLMVVGALAEAATMQLIFRASIEGTWRSVIEGALAVLTVGGGVILFGFFSRRLERQADVYAARTMQHAIAVGNTGEPRRTAVGFEGAAALASALFRAAAINHIPADSRSFRHGSIARRVEFIRALAVDPKRTRDFDRSMFAIYLTLLVSLASGGALITWLAFAGRAAT